MGYMHIKQNSNWVLDCFSTFKDDTGDQTKNVSLRLLMGILRCPYYTIKTIRK